MNNQYPAPNVHLADFENFVVVADPHSMRWEYYERDLSVALRKMTSPPTVHVLDWSTLVARDGIIESLVPDNSLVRVESPARDFQLMTELMQAGQRELGEVETEWTTSRRGWIASPLRMYRGLCRILTRLEDSVNRQQGCCMMASMKDTLILFDKNLTSKKLQAAGLPTPEWFQPVSASEVLDFLSQQNELKNYFLKLANGFSGSGIALLMPREVNQGSDHLAGVSAITSVVEIDGRFFNTHRIHEVVGDQYDEIIEFIISEGATLQTAIEKTRVQADQFDVRVVVNRGEVIGEIFRASKQPITNLHLGGYRAAAAECLREIPRRKWLDGIDACETAAKLFDMDVVGVDLCFDRATFDPYIIEMNSFGDFFPNWKNKSGKSIYELELQKLTR